MRTNLELLQKASALYVLALTSHNSRSITDRYAVYALVDGEMCVLWGEYCGEPTEGYKTTLPYQVYSKLKQYPAFHFCIRGYGFYKVGSLVTELCELVGRRIPAFELGGYGPSSISHQASRKLDEVRA